MWQLNNNILFPLHCDYIDLDLDRHPATDGGRAEQKEGREGDEGGARPEEPGVGDHADAQRPLAGVGLGQGVLQQRARGPDRHVG